MDLHEAYEILHPDTTRQKLAEIEYYGGFAGQQKAIEAVNEACVVACEAILELQLYKENKLCLIPEDVYSKQCAELDEYKQLGTPEEVKAAVEKQKKVKVIKAYDSDVDSHWCSCGNCTKGLCWEHGIKINYCPECGQKLDWG